MTFTSMDHLSTLQLQRVTSSSIPSLSPHTSLSINIFPTPLSSTHVQKSNWDPFRTFHRQSELNSSLVFENSSRKNKVSLSFTYPNFFKIKCQSEKLRELTNVSIRRKKSVGDPILAFMAAPKSLNSNNFLSKNEISEENFGTEEMEGSQNPIPVLILIHEFYGLTKEICSKAKALSEELNCLVLAPDTYRGDVTSFIPKAIYLALTTPQARVNEDIDEVREWASSLPNVDSSRVAVMGFCYGGGKAIRYSAYNRETAVTVVVYGSPITDPEELSGISGPVLAIYGDKDSQFPIRQIRSFEEAMRTAKVSGKVSIYEGMGHAFWSDMEQVANEGPQRKAWLEVTSFLREHLCRNL